MTARIKGILPMVYTSFDASGAIDEEDARRLLNHLLNAGAHRLAAVGGACQNGGDGASILTGTFRILMDSKMGHP